MKSQRQQTGFLMLQQASRESEGRPCCSSGATRTQGPFRLPPPAFPCAAVSMQQRSVGGFERSFTYPPQGANGQASPGSAICMCPGAGQWGGAHGSRSEGDVSPRAGRRVTQREAGPGAGPGQRRCPGEPRGKMSVAGLKKQFHKASQVRGAAPGAGAEAELQRGLCC